MKKSQNHWLGLELALGIMVALFAAHGGRAFAQAPAGEPAGEAAPQVPAGEGSRTPAPAAPLPSQTQPPPGVPRDNEAITLDLAARPVAFIHASGEWEHGYKTIMGELAKVTDAVKKAGLVQSGHPFAVFLDTNDKGFEIDAMIPIAAKPEAKDLPGGVKIGESPSGKAIKFMHRGAYDDIDSTYDLITAFLDEKGLESQNRFIEEYLTSTAEPDDPNFEADIYVLLKQ